MPLFSVSLMFSLKAQAATAPEPLREIAIYVLSAADEDDAEARAQATGHSYETSYENSDGELVRNIFKHVIEVQSLIGDHLFDGIEVASWMFRRGTCVILSDDGITIEAEEEARRRVEDRGD